MTKMTNADGSIGSDSVLIERLIDFEIGRIDARQRNRGWTPWALFAALGGLIWLILNEADGRKLDYANGWLLWALIIYSNLTFKSLRGVLGEKRTSIGSSSRFAFANQEIGSSRMFLCVTCACLVGAFAILSEQASLLSFQAKAAFFILGSLLGVLFFVVLVASYFGLPVPKGEEHPTLGSFIFSALMAVLTAYVAISLWVAVIQKIGWSSIGAWKFALAAFATGEVLGFLLAFRSDEPFLNSLTSIKRDLLLGHLSPEGAKSQLEITLKGMRAGHIMQKPVKDYLALVESVEQKLRQVSDQQNKIWAILQERAKSLTADDEELIRTRVKVMKASLKESSQMMTSIDKLRAHIRTKSRFLARISPNCSKDIDAVWTEMTASLDNVKKVAAESSKVFHQIQAKLGESNKPELTQLWN